MNTGSTRTKASSPFAHLQKFSLKFFEFVVCYARSLIIRKMVSTACMQLLPRWFHRSVTVDCLVGLQR